MNFKTLQTRVRKWVVDCFGEEIADNVGERNERFIEEALELVQASGLPKEDVLMLVDYVYRRPAGEIYQEIGGVVVTLSALCSALNQPFLINGEIELSRIKGKIELIREKQKNKPKNSPLPQ